MLTYVFTHPQNTDGAGRSMLNEVVDKRYLNQPGANLKRLKGGVNERQGT
jgi:hypothetical protein